MQRVHRKRRSVYEEKDFEIVSLNSLIKLAKQKTCDRIETGLSDKDMKSVKLPLQDLTDRLTDSLQQMHHHLQSLLMQKLGPDARNVIAAERARQTRSEKEKMAETNKKLEKKKGNEVENMATTLGELGQDAGDELELLNDYRERYAAILAELLVAKDRLLELEKGLEEHADAKLMRRLSEDISELSEEEDDRPKPRQRRRRRSSAGASSGGFTSDEKDGPEIVRKGLWN
jgi:hypothetical protein